MQGQLKHHELTGQIIKAFYHVYNSLGYGFLEKVYKNAMILTLRKMDLQVEHDVPITVYFEGSRWAITLPTSWLKAS